jgi:U4/U6 small nuclear ribonucleoprotein PRP31
MQYSAPNLTAVVGSTVAAQLIGAAGGINKLANMPSCNVEVLGKKKATLEGFAAATTVRHVGFIMNTDTVKTAPFALQRRVARLVAGKATLAARIDLNRESRDGTQGRQLRDEVERKVEKMQEPPPPRQEKALPAPDEKRRKRRGGKRYRKQKAQMAMTELRKRANRMAFGTPQEEFGNDMKDLGMLGSAEGSGMLRNIGANYDGKGFKVKAKKNDKTKGHQTSAFGFNTASGIATSMYAFTPVQGLELPTSKKPAATKDQDIGYFSTVAGFTSVKKM